MLYKCTLKKIFWHLGLVVLFGTNIIGRAIIPQNQSQPLFCTKDHHDCAIKTKDTERKPQTGNIYKM